MYYTCVIRNMLEPGKITYSTMHSGELNLKLIPNQKLARAII